jgi:hypothetical protein
VVSFGRIANDLESWTQACALLQEIGWCGYWMILRYWDTESTEMDMVPWWTYVDMHSRIVCT